MFHQLFVENNFLNHNIGPRINQTFLVLLDAKKAIISSGLREKESRYCDKNIHLRIHMDLSSTYSFLTKIERFSF
jgi:hypothetical protein